MPFFSKRAAPWVSKRGGVSAVSQGWKRESTTLSPAEEEARLWQQWRAIWERRLRGEDAFPYFVPLEPPFCPFAPSSSPRDPTPPQAPALRWAFLGLRLPHGHPVTAQQWEQALAALHTLDIPLSLELVGRRIVDRDPRATLQIAVPLGFEDAVAARLGAALRLGARESGQRHPIQRQPDSLSTTFPQNGALTLVELALTDCALLPLLELLDLATGPIGAQLAALQSLNNCECAGVQLLLEPASSRWKSEIEAWASSTASAYEALSAFDGAAWKRASAHFRQALARKLEGPLWAASLRVFAFTLDDDQGEREMRLCARLATGWGEALHRAEAQHAFEGAPNWAEELWWEDEPILDERGTHHTRHNTLAPLVIEDQEGQEDEGEEQDGRSPFQTRQLLTRQTRRHGALLSTSEVATLWHPPHAALQAPNLIRFIPDLPLLSGELSAGDGTLLGWTWQIATEDDLAGGGLDPLLEGAEERRVRLCWPEAWRTRHAYALGATRMGKSTLLLNMIAQDMAAGRGLCLIDPHGDLARDVLALVPPHREAETLFLDLSDTDYPPALDLLQAADENQAAALVSDLLSILARQFAASWGDRLEHILRHALRTLLADGSQKHTLRDLRPLLWSSDYRAQVLSRLDDPDLLAFWEREFEAYPASALAPIANKLGLLLGNPIVRNIVCAPPLDETSRVAEASHTAAPPIEEMTPSQPLGDESEGEMASPEEETDEDEIADEKEEETEWDSDAPDDLPPLSLDPAEWARNRRIVIVNLASGQIGGDNAAFLGALLVSRVQLSAMHTLRQSREERAPFTLYVDEFQSFVTSSFEKILSEAGKTGLSLVLANQYLEQLSDKLQNAVLSNVGALIAFRVSAGSGRRLAPEFGSRFEASHLCDQNRGQAVVRLGRARDSFALFTLPPATPRHTGTDPDGPARVIAQTRARVCRPRAEVEALLLGKPMPGENDPKESEPARENGTSKEKGQGSESSSPPENTLETPTESSAIYSPSVVSEGSEETEVRPAPPATSPLENTHSPTSEESMASNNPSSFDWGEEEDGE